MNTSKQTKENNMFIQVTQAGDPLLINTDQIIYAYSVQGGHKVNMKLRGERQDILIDDSINEIEKKLMHVNEFKNAVNNNTK